MRTAMRSTRTGTAIPACGVIRATRVAPSRNALTVNPAHTVEPTAQPESSGARATRVAPES